MAQELVTVEAQEIREVTGETGLTNKQVEVLKGTLLKGLSPSEMGLVFHQAKEYGLSIFRKELWAYKDGRGNLVTIAGRDGLLKIAAKNPNFGGLRSGAVYEKDTVEIDLGAGTIRHVPCLTARGALLGAWAAVYRTGFLPLVVYVAKEDVARNTPVWSAKPAEMTLARVESMALRRADVGTGGLYLEDEVADLADQDAKAAVDVEQVRAEAAAKAEEVRKTRKAARKEEPKAAPAPEAVRAELLASDEQVAAFAKKCGGETYAKKHLLRALGHDNLHAVPLAKLAEMEKALEPQPVEATLAAVAAKEAAAGETAPKSTLEKLRAAWLDPRLPEGILAHRAKPEREADEVEMVLNRRAAFSELTPTEAERMLSAVLERNRARLQTEEETEEGELTMAEAITAAWSAPHLPETVRKSLRTPGALLALASTVAKREITDLANLADDEGKRLMEAIVNRNKQA